MDFSFLHAADLHLGSPFLGLSSTDEELARRVASASREAFEGLVDQAIERQVSFVVIAGDVYDGDWKDTTIGHFFNRQMARLARANIPVYQVRGNHDADSVITSAVTLPETVRVFSSKRPETFRIPELRVALHGQSFANRSVPENLAQKYPVPEPAWFNIGVLHTSCDGRPPHANYAPCSVQDLLQRSYQYWALGHCHEYEVVNTTPPVIFPGNLQGRSIRECGPKGAVIVEVEGGDVTNFSRLDLGRIQWALISADLTGTSTEEEAFEVIRTEIQKRSRPDRWYADCVSYGSFRFNASPSNALRRTGKSCGRSTGRRESLHGRNMAGIGESSDFRAFDCICWTGFSACIA